MSTKTTIRNDAPTTAPDLQAAPSRAYADDLYGWVGDQVALLQAHDVGSIDVSHIMEELAVMGRGEFNKLVSAVRLVILHLLKWDHQPERRSRSWAATIREQRRQIAYGLRDSPALKPKINEAVLRAYPAAAESAAEETRLSEDVFPGTCPYTWDDITQRPVVWSDDTRERRPS
jgi:hypothetical protein